MALRAHSTCFAAVTAICSALCSCSGSCSGTVPANYPQMVIQPLAVLLDTGKGSRRTVIEGQASEENNRFLLPLPGVTIELWLGSQRLRATHADINGHFIFVETLSNGEYTVKAADCPSVQATLAVLRDRSLEIALTFPQSCGSTQN
jgi:hypothetical protein